MSPWPVALPGPRQRGPSLPRSGCPQPRPSVVSPARENGAEKGNPEPTGTGTQSHRDPSCSPATLAPSRGVHGPWDPCRSRSTGIHSTPGTGTGTSPGAPGCTAPPGAGTGPGGTRIRSTRYTGPPGVQNGPPPPPPAPHRASSPGTGASPHRSPRARRNRGRPRPPAPLRARTRTPPPTSVLRREPAPAAHSRPGFPAAAALPPPVPVQRGPGAGSGGDGGFIPARPGRAIVGRRRRPGSAFPPRPGRSRGRRRPRCAAPPAPAPGREYRRAGTVRGRGGNRGHRGTPGRGGTGIPGIPGEGAPGSPGGIGHPTERDPLGAPSNLWRGDPPTSHPRSLGTLRGGHRGSRHGAVPWPQAVAFTLHPTSWARIGVHMGPHGPGSTGPPR